MQIDKISVYRVRTPLLTPFRTAFGNDAEIEAIMVRIVSGDNYAWGEASPWEYPAYSSESGAGCFLAATKFMAPLLLGKNINSGDELQKVLSCIKGNQFAKAAFDLAWWNLQAKLDNLPLWKKIGGKSPDVDCGEDFGVEESIERLLERMDDAAAAGFKRIKLKYRPGWELNMLKPVRERFPSLPIHIDCNSAYTLKDIDMFKELDKFNLEMIEQPLMHDDLLCHAELQKQLKTPICLDESITSPEKAEKAVKLGACGFINIKPGRVGGITNALKIHDIAQAAGIPCWIGGMLESSVGAHFCIALATLPNIKYPSDIFATDRFWARDLGKPQMKLSGKSKFRAPDTIGAGAEPDAEYMLERIQEVRHFTK